jgi:hypothetical protein
MADQEFKQGDILRFRTQKSGMYLTVHHESMDGWDYIHQGRLDGGGELPTATFTVSKVNDVYNFQVSQPNGTNVGWLSNDIDKGAKYIYANNEVLNNNRGWKIEGNKQGFYLQHLTENKWLHCTGEGYCCNFTADKNSAAFLTAENRW